MILKTNELEIGDVFYFHYYEKDNPCEVVDIEKLYSLETYLPVKVVIIDFWVDEKDHQQIKLPEDGTWDVIYRRNTEYKTIKNSLKRYENKTEENKQ